MDIALVLHVDTDDEQFAMTTAHESALTANDGLSAGNEVVVLGPVTNTGESWVGTSESDVYPVAFTTWEALALRRGHTDTQAWETAQAKLAASMKSEVEDAENG